MPAMAYIQDMQSRLTLLTAQALGVSSLHSGELGSVPWGPALELGCPPSQGKQGRKVLQAGQGALVLLSLGAL